MPKFLIRSRRWAPLVMASLLAAAPIPVAVAQARALGSSQGMPPPPPTRDDHRKHRQLTVSWERLREIDRVLAEAKAATARFADTEAARAAGYKPTTPVLYGIGAHWVNQELLDSGRFDPARPQVLLYDYALGGGLELVGVSWALAGPRGAAPDHLAPLAHWHAHAFARNCIGTRGRQLFQTLPLDEAACRTAGHVYFRDEPWFLHAWLFRPGPEGIFSHSNSTLE